MTPGRGPPGRRRRAVRGLPALPVPVGSAEEPGALAVRVLSPDGAAAAGVGEPQRADRVGADAARRRRRGCTSGSCRCSGARSSRLVDGRYVPVDRLRVGDTDWVPWHEAVEREVVRHRATAAGRRAGAGTEVEALSDPDGRAVGRLVRTRWPVTAELTVAATELDGYRCGWSSACATPPAGTRPSPAATSPPGGPWSGTHLLVTGGRVRLAASTRRRTPRRRPPVATTTAGGRCWWATRCWSRRSSCRTSRRSRRRARATCSTRPRSTRSSRCG